MENPRDTDATSAKDGGAGSNRVLGNIDRVVICPDCQGSGDMVVKYNHQVHRKTCKGTFILLWIPFTWCPHVHVSSVCWHLDAVISLINSSATHSA